MEHCAYMSHDYFLTATEVAKRYHRTKMTLWRWLKGNLGFPKPVYIGRNRYWREQDLVNWERSLPRADSEHGRSV